MTTVEGEKENKSKDGFGKGIRPDVRVAVVGNVDSGKSTLIGVLTGGSLDDGRGSARSKIFVHRHEAANGRTSYCSQHILGFSNNFDEEPQTVIQPVAASGNAVQKNKSWRNVVKNSKRIVTLVDLAGHEKYLKTTIAGLTGNYPDYAMLLVGANMGVTLMTKEHLGVVCALSVPLVCVLTKTDIAPNNVYSRTKTHLTRILKVKKRKAFDIKNEDDLNMVLQNENPKLVPIFSISCVTGDGMNLFKSYLSKLKSRRKEWNIVNKDNEEMELSIDETWNVGGIGLVVSGNVMSGKIEQNTVGYLGPFSDGTYRKIHMKTLHCKRTPVTECMIGSSCSVAIKTANRKQPLEREMIHRGMVIISENSERKASWGFQADIMVMHHATSIRKNYEAVIHVGLIRQTARLMDIDQEYLRSGDRSNALFKFVSKPEHIHVGQRFIFREGATKGVGKISRVIYHEPFLIEK